MPSPLHTYRFECRQDFLGAFLSFESSSFITYTG